MPEENDEMTLEELRRTISEADQAYYLTGDCQMPDERYDKLKRQLAKLSPGDPLIKRVGANVRDSMLTLVAHEIPMGSLNNALTLDEFLNWNSRMRTEMSGREYLVFCSLKMDGCSLSLKYVDGLLVQAVTRGDGLKGEDVTANAAAIPTIPKRLTGVQRDFTGYVRGEVVLPREAFEKLKEEAPEGSKPANPRNAGNGILRRKDGTGAEVLEFRAFRLHGSFPQLENPSTMVSMFTRLETMGFLTAPWVCQLDYRNRGLAAAITWRAWFAQEETAETRNAFVAANTGGLQTLGWGGWTHSPVHDPHGYPIQHLVGRAELPFDIDGIVVSINDLTQQESLGVKDQRPNGEIAFKFPAQAKTTILEAVEWQLGRTGKLTPVAILAPVEVGGVTITRATLCNPEEIRRLGVGIGDEVRISRQGDVIPKVREVVKKCAPDSKVEIPTKCPVTGGAITRAITSGGESADIYSADFTMSQQRVEKHLEHWATTNDIKGFGPKAIQALGKAYPGVGPAAFYRWADSDVSLDGVSEKVQAKLRKAVAGARTLTIENMIGGLGVPNLGRSRVKSIVEKVPMAQQPKHWVYPQWLLQHAEELSLPNIAQSIVDAISTEFFMALLLDLLDCELQVEKPAEVKDGALMFCLTGSFPGMRKDDIHDRITAAGHEFVTSMRKDVTHLVAADPASGSSKLDKAKKAGTAVIGLDELWKLLDGDQS